MINILKYDYITKKDALTLAKLLESTSYTYLSLTASDVEEFSIVMDGSIDGLKEGELYYQVHHDGFYASLVDFINFYNKVTTERGIYEKRI